MKYEEVHQSYEEQAQRLLGCGLVVFFTYSQSTLQHEIAKVWSFKCSKSSFVIASALRAAEFLCTLRQDME